MRLQIVPFLVTLGLGVAPAFAGEPDPAIESFLRTLEGRSYELRVPVLRVDAILGHIDTTYAYPDGRILYKYLLSGFRKTVTDDARELARDIRHAARMRDDEYTRPRIWRPGTRVRVHGMRVKDKEAQVNITRLFDGSRSSVRIVADDGGRITLRDVREALPLAFLMGDHAPRPPRDNGPAMEDEEEDQPGDKGEEGGPRPKNEEDARDDEGDN